MKRKYMKIFGNLLSLILIIVGLVFVLPKVLLYFMPFVIGFLFSLLIYPIVRFLEDHIKIKRKFVTTFMIIVVIAIIVLICYALFSLLSVGIASFVDYLPTFLKNAENEIDTAGLALQKIFKNSATTDINSAKIKKAAIDSISKFVTDTNDGLSAYALLVAGKLPDILVGVITGLLATYFFVADREQMVKFINDKMPFILHDTTIGIFKDMGKAVGGYFKAQFKIMGIIYIIVWVGLLIIDVKYAWLIGFGIAFLDMLPMFGTGTALWPWALVKLLTGDYKMALSLMLIYIVALLVHQIIQPKFVGDTVGLNPFLALLFMFIGYKISSVLGLILAIPIGMIIMNLWNAGAFDNYKWCFKEIWKDFTDLIRIEEDVKPQ